MPDDLSAYATGEWLFPEEAVIAAAEHTVKGLKAMLRKLDRREAGELSVVFPGNVVPKARPRTARGGTQTYMPPVYRKYRDDLALAMTAARRGGPGLTAPVHLEVEVYRKDWRRSDNDGLLGTVMDAGTIAGWWADDTWTVIPYTTCYTQLDRDNPRVEIRAYTMGAE